MNDMTAGGGNGRVVYWWEPDMGDPVIVSLDDHRQIPAPLGKILGGVRIDDALRICHETALADAGLTASWEPHITLGDNTLTLWRPSDSTSRWWTETDISDQLPFGYWNPGGWAWQLADPQPLAEPIPAKGKQGVWEWKEGTRG